MKLLLYCTKAKPYLVQGVAKPMHTLDTTNPFNFNWKLVNKGFSNDRLNGKIVAECDFEVDEIHFLFNEGEELTKNKGWRNYRYVIDSLKYDEFYKKSCLSFSGLDEYFNVPNENGKVGYAIHIKNLHIFDEPRELSDFYKDDYGYQNALEYYNWFLPVDCNFAHPITKAPQNMMYAKDRMLEDYILISIKPEWLCKILNGEKTIEVRKKVLREMLK